MNKTHYFYIILLLTIFFICCNKPPIESEPIPPSYDTIFPLPYFPVFPNSYWKYSNSTGDTNIYSTSPYYLLDGKFNPNTNNYEYLFYVPVYNCDRVRKYTIYSGTNIYYENYKTKRLLPVDNINTGVYFNSSAINISPYSIWRKVIKTNQTILINGILYNSVVIIREFTILSNTTLCIPHTFDTIFSYTDHYYAKNVGLIREDSVSFDTIIYQKNLIEYYINN